MPIFADLIMSNESGLKEHLRLIFLDISTSIQESYLSHSSPFGIEEHKVGGSSGGEF